MSSFEKLSSKSQVFWMLVQMRPILSTSFVLMACFWSSRAMVLLIEWRRLACPFTGLASACLIFVLPIGEHVAAGDQVHSEILKEAEFRHVEESRVQR